MGDVSINKMPFFLFGETREGEIYAIMGSHAINNRNIHENLLFCVIFNVFSMLLNGE